MHNSQESQCFTSIQREEGQNDLATKHDSHHLINKPALGMLFDSENEAYDSYNLYARAVDFSVRKSYTTKCKKTGNIVSRLLVCSKQGHKDTNDEEFGKQVKRRKREVRVDCGAHLQVAIRGDGRWEVRKFEEKHTHILATPTKVLMLRSHNDAQKDSGKAIEAFHNAGMGPSLISKVLNFSGEPSITPKMCSDHLKKTRQNNLGEECIGVIRYFQKKMAKDKDFIFSWKVDKNNIARSVFWADSRSRDSYAIFEDVVSFDTTYRTNKLCMQFAPFTGVNHHRQSILFGCALLADETEETFTWLFETWLECMHDQHSKCIITDQDVAMENAISKVFPNTRHMYCIWHIQRNAMSNLQNLYALENFQQDYGKWIHDSSSIEDFEATWPLLQEKYGISDDHWLAIMYKKRQHWVSYYLNDVFAAGIRTTQRSESMNSFFDGFVNSNTSLTEFVHQYDKAVSSRREAEKREDFKNMNSKAHLLTNSSLEKHARDVYIDKKFCIFQKEFLHMFDFNSTRIEQQSCKAAYYVYTDEDDKDKKRKLVKFNDQPTVSVNCSCNKFERDGIFCSHALYILKIENITRLPEKYILHRWTMNARYSMKRKVHDNTSTSDNGQQTITPIQDWNFRHNMKIATEMGLQSADHLRTAALLADEFIEKLSLICNSSQSCSVVASVAQTSNTQVLNNIVIYDPPRVKSKGRPKKLTRIKSSIEILMSHKEKKVRSRGKHDKKEHTIINQSSLDNSHMGQDGQQQSSQQDSQQDTWEPNKASTRIFNNSTCGAVSSTTTLLGQKF